LQLKKKVKGNLPRIVGGGSERRASHGLGGKRKKKEKGCKRTAKVVSNHQAIGGREKKDASLAPGSGVEEKGDRNGGLAAWVEEKKRKKGKKKIFSN